MNKNKTGFLRKQGNPMELGTVCYNGWMNFAVFVPFEEKCRLNLYDKKSNELVDTVLLTKEDKTGNIFSVMLKPKKQTGSKKSYDFSELKYMYQVNNQEFMDPYAKKIYGRENYGKRPENVGKAAVKGGFLTEDFNWVEDRPLRIPFSELILYKLHVRGFTKHPSSGVIFPGTFNGVTEKIEYLKELGVNGILLMPSYEYNEFFEQKGFFTSNKLNYWGFSEENGYFAPKASYASEPDQAAQEFKTMVNRLHANGIEVLMEMNFTKGTNQLLILDCLRYWVLQYHIDGFHFQKDSVPANLLATDPILGLTKLLTESWDINQIYSRDFLPPYKNLAEYNAGYSVDIKRYLRGDEEQVGNAACRLKGNNEKYGIINYITNHDGFTLMDLYSYDVRHNESNGENNQDGADYNYSWNCGTEGNTRNNRIIRLRKKQIRNALTFLFLSQGTPLLLAGDEFGNSQNGNNNAYCQDNESSWLNWDCIKKNRDILIFVKYMTALRKCHPVLHMEQPLRSMDYISCGFPDISFHGKKAWYPDYNHYSRLLGILLSGHYVKINRSENDRSFYIACNMHWENHNFDLPNPPSGRKWAVLLNTEEDMGKEIKDIQPLENQRTIEIKARSIVIFIGI